MQVRRSPARIDRPGSVLAGIALGLALIASGTAAPAASAESGEGEWAVSPGGAFSATASAEIRNVTRNWTIACDSLQVSGTAPSGNELPSYPIVSIESSTFAGCSGPSGLTFDVSASDLFWEMNAESYDASLGKTTGTLYSIELKLAASNNCVADVGGPDGPGSAAATHTNSNGRLSVGGGDLAITFTNFACAASLVSTGDTIEFTTGLDLSPVQTITGPTST